MTVGGDDDQVALRLARILGNFKAGVADPNNFGHSSDAISLEELVKEFSSTLLSRGFVEVTEQRGWCRVLKFFEHVQHMHVGWVFDQVQGGVDRIN